MATVALVNKVIKRLSILPKKKQREYARSFLCELDDNEKWEKAFANTTDEQWEKMERMVEKDIKEGKTSPLTLSDFR